MNYTHKCNNVCSSVVSFDIVDDIVSNIQFTGGCNGNLKGVASLAEGMNTADVIKRISGITCGRNTTSCPAQLAIGIEAAIKK